MDTVYPQGKKNEIVRFEGFTCAQIFLGLTSNLVFLSLMHTESEGPDALLDFIRYAEYPKTLYSDKSKMHPSKVVNKIFRKNLIPETIPESHHPWNSPAQRLVQGLKKLV